MAETVRSLLRIMKVTNPLSGARPPFGQPRLQTLADMQLLVYMAYVHRSQTAKIELHEAQKVRQLPDNTLSKHVPTRWWSITKSVAAFLENEPAVKSLRKSSFSAGLLLGNAAGNFVMDHHLEGTCLGRVFRAVGVAPALHGAWPSRLANGGRGR